MCGNFYLLKEKRNQYFSKCDQKLLTVLEEDPIFLERQLSLFVHCGLSTQLKKRNQSTFPDDESLDTLSNVNIHDPSHDNNLPHIYLH